MLDKKVQVTKTVAIISLLLFSGLYVIKKKYKSHVSQWIKEINSKHVKLKYIYSFDLCETELQKILQTNPTLVGLDCEWVKSKNKQVSVITLCFQNICYVLQCHKWDKLPESLFNLLTSPKLSTPTLIYHPNKYIFTSYFKYTES